jgi:hypothetical protein
MNLLQGHPRSVLEEKPLSFFVCYMTTEFLKNIHVNLRVDSPVKNICPVMRVSNTGHQTPIFLSWMTVHVRGDGSPLPSTACSMNLRGQR